MVTLDQSSTETLLALGLAARMAGTSNLKTRVAPRFQADYETIPVLNPKKLTGEQLRAATPDLVMSSFAALYTREQVGTREELAELGLPSFVSAVDCPAANGAGATPFDLLFTDYEKLGRVFGVEDRAAALVAEQRAVLEQAGGTRRSLREQPSVVWLYSVFNGLPYVAGKGGMPSAMSQLVGARNAFDDVDQQWPEVSWEQIAQRDPDIIVVGDLSERGAPGDSAQEKLAMMRRDPVVSELSAVRENRIIQVPGIEMDPSVRTVDALRVLIDGLRTLGYVR
ncbi:ABC transporter substrate-binding protein [Micromonospora sp. WMMD882]|uniref:ABC transporter substrate-binding protein n=1 Tax=Micromonospora sp. WMMD882 TaxID=3015151 RepID=UPI00248C5577|nr:ABC transporter substrate-binding protein [Micromonospora sp. WMMD882]WBB78490.1 ABC transporter substrate-binding protein [Micromonospora sp. WMMD882]